MSDIGWIIVLVVLWNFTYGGISIRINDKIYTIELYEEEPTHDQQ